MCMETVSKDTSVRWVPTTPFQTMAPSRHSTTSPLRIRRVACSLIMSPPGVRLSNLQQVLTLGAKLHNAHLFGSVASGKLERVLRRP